MIKRINSSKQTEYLYCLVISVITLFGWYFKSKWGYMTIIPVTLLAVTILNDFKYMAISGLGLIFSVGTGYTANTLEFPMQFAVAIVLYVAIGLIYIIRNGIHIKNVKSCIGLLALGILSPIPLIWNNVIEANERILYFVYLSYFLYLLIYILFVVTLKKDSFRMIKTAMVFMTLVIALECIFASMKFGFVKGINLGWAITIDAGITMLVGLPFIFIDLIHEKNYIKLIISDLILIVVIFGCALTVSRGTYLFGIIELGLLYIFSLIKAKKKIFLLLSTLVVLIAAVLTLHFTITLPEAYHKVVDIVFAVDFNDNGRFRLWQKAYDIWKQNGLNIVFGAGIMPIPSAQVISEFGLPSLIYFHSTFFELLGTLGVLGVLAYLFHMFEKYKQLFKLNLTCGVVMLIGYLAVDAYGLIDNTFACYYYMIPLMIVMASLDTLNKGEFDMIMDY